MQTKLCNERPLFLHHPADEIPQQTIGIIKKCCCDEVSDGPKTESPVFNCCTVVVYIVRVVLCLTTQYHFWFQWCRLSRCFSFCYRFIDIDYSGDKPRVNKSNLEKIEKYIVGPVKEVLMPESRKAYSVKWHTGGIPQESKDQSEVSDVTVMSLWCHCDVTVMSQCYYKVLLNNNPTWNYNSEHACRLAKKVNIPSDNQFLLYEVKSLSTTSKDSDLNPCNIKLI